jgi:hypothetical protein
MMKIAGSGSGSISQRHGSADPDPHHPQHWFPGPAKTFRPNKVKFKHALLSGPPKISGGPSQIIQAFEYGCASQEFEDNMTFLRESL